MEAATGVGEIAGFASEATIGPVGDNSGGEANGGTGGGGKGEFASRLSGIGDAILGPTTYTIHMNIFSINYISRILKMHCEILPCQCLGGSPSSPGIRM